MLVHSVSNAVLLTNTNTVQISSKKGASASLSNNSFAQASFDSKMARIRVLQQAQALYLRQNSLTVGLSRQQVLSPALSVTRRSIATTASLLQQKEPEPPAAPTPAPAPVEAEATVEKRKHITEEIASHNATKDLLAAEETSHNITKVDSWFYTSHFLA